MFPFVYVLVFEVNDCLQTQLCRLIRLCLYLFRKCITRLLVWTVFRRWVLPCIEIAMKFSLSWLHRWSPKKFSSFLLPFSDPLHADSWCAFSGRESSQYQKLKTGIQACLCHCDQVSLSFRLPHSFFPVCSLSDLEGLLSVIVSRVLL